MTKAPMVRGLRDRTTCGRIPGFQSSAWAVELLHLFGFRLLYRLRKSDAVREEGVLTSQATCAERI